MPSTLARRTAALAFAVALALGPAAARAAKKYDPGASDTEIKLGMAMPFSGPASSYGIIGRVAEAYFKMLNEQGGINGRKVTVLAYDNQYSPPKTAEVTRKLVEQDEVLAIFGNLGSAANAAVVKYMNAKKVPHLFLGVGAERFNDPKGAPWTTPFMPSYDGEGRLYATHILQTKPDAKIAVLYQNDDFGKDLLKGLKAGLGPKASKMIVGEASYEMTDPTVDSQIIQLKATGANVVLHFSTIRFAAQAIRKVWEIGWRPDAQYLTYVSAYVKATLEPAGLEASKGMLAMAFFKDPTQPRWANDPASQEYLAFMKKYLPGEDVTFAAGSYAFCLAQTMAHVLRSAGDDLTRENVLRQATTLKGFAPSMLLPGLTMNTTPTDYFPFSALQLVRFDGKEFAPVGGQIVVK
jgi:branched-chain amino acid transport system substrate-binding protein